MADRLLGDAGRPLLDQLLEQTKQVAAKHQWPLKRIRVEHYQDPEVDWEYMLVTLDFDCSRADAEPLFWDSYIKNVVGAMHKGLEGLEKDIFSSKISYELESDP